MQHSMQPHASAHTALGVVMAAQNLTEKKHNPALNTVSSGNASTK